MVHFPSNLIPQPTQFPYSHCHHDILFINFKSPTNRTRTGRSGLKLSNTSGSLTTLIINTSGKPWNSLPYVFFLHTTLLLPFVFFLLTTSLLSKGEWQDIPRAAGDHAWSNVSSYGLPVFFLPRRCDLKVVLYIRDFDFALELPPIK